MTKLQITKLEAAIKADLRAFLDADPGPSGRTPQGPLTVAERRERLSFAQKYTAQPVRDWMVGVKLEMAELVDLDPGLDRANFARLCLGRWVELEELKHG